MGAVKMGVIPEGDEAEGPERVNKNVYMPEDLLEDLKRVQAELKYRSLNKLIVAGLRYFVERHDADKKSKR